MRIISNTNFININNIDPKINIDINNQKIYKLKEIKANELKSQHEIDIYKQEKEAIYSNFESIDFLKKLSSGADKIDEKTYQNRQLLLENIAKFKLLSSVNSLTDLNPYKFQNLFHNNLKFNEDEVGIDDVSFIYTTSNVAALSTFQNRDKGVMAMDDEFYKDSYYSRGYFLPQKNITLHIGLGNHFTTNRIEYLEKNLNSYAKENTINTNFGKVEVFLDLYDDNDSLNIGKFTHNTELFMLDSNRNGKLESSDKYFDKLKIRAYDKDGNEIIKKLSEVVSHIDLRDFINDKKISEALSSTSEKRIVNYHSPYQGFKPEYRYEQMDKKEVKSMFKNYADKDGWIDLREGSKLLDSKHSKYINFAYEKLGFDKEVQLSEFIMEPNYYLNKPNYISDSRIDLTYTEHQKFRFDSLYSDYTREKQRLEKHTKDFQKALNEYGLSQYADNFKDYKSEIMLNIERVFEKVTNLDFSMQNLNKVKDAFSKDINKAAASIQDTDAVVAMKLNDDQTITLKFNSGRELRVKNLYSDSGGLLDDGKVAINLKAKTMNEEELNKLNFNVTAIKITNEKTKEDEFVSLKDLGAKIIKKLNSRFEILTNNNKFYSVDNLYMMFKFEDIAPKNKDEMLYPKPFDVKV